MIITATINITISINTTVAINATSVTRCGFCPDTGLPRQSLESASSSPFTGFTLQRLARV